VGDTLGKEVGDELGNVLGKLVGLMLRVGGVEGTADAEGATLIVGTSVVCSRNKSSSSKAYIKSRDLAFLFAET